MAKILNQKKLGELETYVRSNGATPLDDIMTKELAKLGQGTVKSYEELVELEKKLVVIIENFPWEECENESLVLVNGCTTMDSYLEKALKFIKMRHPGMNIKNLLEKVEKYKWFFEDMKCYAIPWHPSSSVAKKPKGDSSNKVYWFILFILLLVGILMIARKRKGDNKK